MFFLTTIGMGAGIGYTWWYMHHLTLTLPVPTPPKIDRLSIAANKAVSPLQLQYTIDVPGRGEIFPALSAASPTDYWPVAILGITNNSDQAVAQVVHAEIPGWSRPLQQSIIAAPRETVALPITPDLLPAAYQASEIERASLVVSVSDATGLVVYAQTRPMLIHSGSDLYWGKQFANAQLVARWVTPHDAPVLELVSEAHRYIAQGRMVGYNLPSQQTNRIPGQVKAQAEAVFRALKASGYSYVSSIFTFGGFTDVAQRIRLPRETLDLDTANCMDISVAFASAIENIGLQPVIVIIPGHAFTGVRLSPGSADILYLDLTVLPNGTFKQAIARAQQWRKQTAPGHVLTVDIASARRMGIYPIPSSPAAEKAPGTISAANTARPQERWKP